MKYEIRKFDWKLEGETNFFLWCSPDKEKYFSAGILLGEYEDRKEMIQTAKELSNDPKYKGSVICYGYTDADGKYHDEDAFFCR